MKRTQEQEIKIRLLSDRELYQAAVEFIRENGKIKSTQINSGLENSATVAKGISDIITFTRHQADKEGKEYQLFYKKLTHKLKELKKKVKDEYGFVPEELVKKEMKKYTEFYGLLIAREFIHHLSAEHSYRS